jgi:prephenate dehydrogenase
MAAVNVAILGLERLGASFGLALKRYMQEKDARHTFTIKGYDERGYNGKQARRIGAVDSATHNAADAVENAHIVLLTVPYHKMGLVYEQIGAALMPGAVVLDVSPLKKPSLQWAADHLPQDPAVAAYMVGIAPVLNPDTLYEANNEVEVARADLFDRGTMILAPAADCPGEAVELAAEVARIVGASVHFMDPDEHDGLAGAIEGLPALLAVSLFQTMIRSEGWDDMRRLTNPAFGLATSPLRFQHFSALWAMLHYNRENTVRHLDALLATLQEIRDNLATDEDGFGLEALLEQGASRYEEWEGNRLTNQWRKAEAADEDMESGGVLSAMGGMLFGRRPPRKKDDSESNQPR